MAHTNGARHPYVQNNFEGTISTRRTFKDIEERSKLKTKPLMSDELFTKFCAFRTKVLRLDKELPGSIDMSVCMDFLSKYYPYL